MKLFSFLNPKTEFDARFRNISTLVVKVTHRCNLDCLYCYENITKKGEDMSEATFRQLADLVLEHSVKPSVTFLFHGGEPTLLPNDWYQSCIEYALQKAKEQGKEARFSMQTNLLGINAAKIDLFLKYNIQLGISLDGPALLGSTMRGGEDKVFQHFKQLQSKGVQAGVLMTINPANYEHFFTICPWLVDEAEAKSFKANVVTPVGRGYESEMMRAEQIFEAQHAILEYMIQTEGKNLIESNISMELQRFFADKKDLGQLRQTLCHEQHCGAGSSVLGITPMGDLLPCGRFQWDDVDYFLGNLQEEDYLQKSYQKKYKKSVDKFHQLVPSSWYDCKTCEAKDVCGFGCQAFIVRSKEQANVDCLPTKMRFQFYLENKERLRPVYEAICKMESGSNRTDRKGPIGFKIKGEDGNTKTYTIND